MADLPTRGVYSGSRVMTEWIEGGSETRGLWGAATYLSKALLVDRGELYNALYHIQVRA